VFAEGLPCLASERLRPGTLPALDRWRDHDYLVRHLPDVTVHEATPPTVQLMSEVQPLASELAELAEAAEAAEAAVKRAKATRAKVIGMMTSPIIGMMTSPRPRLVPTTARTTTRRSDFARLPNLGRLRWGTAKTRFRSKHTERRGPWPPLIPRSEESPRALRQRVPSVKDRSPRSAG
jgi:hypothetical protein